jgi:hypothetical protein
MPDKRRRCPERVKRSLLERQGYRCLYCGVIFGSVLRRGTRRIVTSPVWDHRVPFAYLGRNPVGNWRASCATCNLIKSDLVFINLVAIRRYIRTRWAEKHIDLVWSPEVSSEEDPYDWAVKFAKYMANLAQPEVTDIESGPQYVARKSGARIVLDSDDEPVTAIPEPRPPRDELAAAEWLSGPSSIEGEAS